MSRKIPQEVRLLVFAMLTFAVGAATIHLCEVQVLSSIPLTPQIEMVMSAVLQATGLFFTCVMVIEIGLALLLAGRLFILR